MVNDQTPLLARQPILNLSLKVVGYELLCRPAPQATLEWQHQHGDVATSELLITAFNDIGIETITEGLPAYINFTRYWLMNPPLFTAKKIVAEILEHILPTEQNIQAVQKLNELGFKIALDDFDGTPEKSKFFPYIHLVKVDLRQLEDLTQLASIIERYREHNLIWLAEKVETVEEFELCKSAGCTLFQGYFFSQPLNVYGKRLPDSQHSVLQLLHVLNDQNSNIEQVANILKTDPQLSYKVLKTVNSAAYSSAREVTSINQAIMLLGLNRLKAWANVIALGKLNHKPDVLRDYAVIRAFLCQALQQYWPSLDKDTAFTIGLLSLLPGFLDASFEEICKQINLPQEIADALIHFEGDLGFILKTAISMEKGSWDDIQWEELARHNLSAQTLKELYLDSLKKSKALLSSLES